MFNQKVIFSKELCSDIISLCNEWHRSKVYANHGVHEFELSNFRKSSQSVHFTYKQDPIYSALNEYVSTYNLKFTADKLKYMVCKYQEGEFVKYHNDSYGDPVDRKYSLVAQLSPGNAYSGGDFAYYTKKKRNKLILERELGNALMFPSEQYHEVEKVTKGTRYSFVMFIPKQDISSNMSVI